MAGSILVAAEIISAEAIGTIFVLNLISTVALSIVSMALTDKSRGTSEQSTSLSRGIQANTCDTAARLPVIYGKQKVGINRAYIGTTGTDNKTLHIIGTICEGEIEGVYQDGGVDQIFLDDVLYTSYGGLVYYEIFTGTSTQNVCSTLQSAIPTWNDPLRYTAYIYLQLTYDSNYFQGIPNVTLIIEGKKIYNPVTEVTEYSTNPAIQARDFCTTSSRRGGVGISSTRFDSTSVASAISYCDDKSWDCNIVLDGEDVAVDMLSDIVATYRGDIIYSMINFYFKYRDMNYESSVMDIDEDDVIESGGKSTLSIKQPDIFETPNAVSIKFIDPELGYEDNTYLLPDNSACVSDGDYRQKDITIRGISTYSNAMKMANYWLEKLRQNKRISFQMGSRGIALEPFDLFRITHSRPGWTNEIYRVTEHHTTYDGNTIISAEQEESTFYDDIYYVLDRIYYNTNLPSPLDTILSVTSVSNTESVYTYRDRSYTRWIISFSSPNSTAYPFWDYAEVWIKIGSSGDWKFMTKSTSGYILDPVEEGETYYCNLVSVTIWGTKQAFNDGYIVSKQIVGKTSTPSNVTGLTALAHGDNVSIYANVLDESDISGYEVRLGTAWNGGIFIGFNETPNIRLIGVRPGTHTFWMAAKDNAGYYSGTPSSKAVTVFYPSGYANIDTWAWDYDGIGTHSNTEYTTYSGDDAVKCSHTSGVLTGTWTSPEYDLGSEQTVRIWGDFVTAFSSSSGTWTAALSSGSTWTAALEASMTWNQTLAPSYAGQLAATIYWGTSSGSLTNSASRFEILAPEITARYVQVVLTITDPDDGSYLYVKTLNMTTAYWS